MEEWHGWDRSQYWCVNDQITAVSKVGFNPTGDLWVTIEHAAHLYHPRCQEAETFIHH